MYRTLFIYFYQAFLKNLLEMVYALKLSNVFYTNNVEEDQIF